MSETITLRGRVTGEYVFGRGRVFQLKDEKGQVSNVEFRGDFPKLYDSIVVRASPGRYSHVGLSWEKQTRGRVERPAVGDFDGETYDSGADHGRLNRQLQRVFEVVVDGRWRTLEELEVDTGFPQASISARLRDLRKPKFGGYTVERRARGSRARGLNEYRLVKPGE